jgi:D-alanyl-D-alanine dipeptidase
VRANQFREPVSALNRIRLIECGEPLVPIAGLLPLLRQHSVPYARESVVRMLADAIDRLPAGYGLGLREAWRSIERQKFVYDRYFEKLREEHPDWPLSALRRAANRFYAPYDQAAPPGHSTGGAIDVWLTDANGGAIDLHGPGDRFANAPTFAPGLPEETRRGRSILFSAMTDAGFTNCLDEWWHYSYGDAAWAVRTGRAECQYGFAPLPPELYAAQDDAYIADVLAGRL